MTPEERAAHPWAAGAQPGGYGGWAARPPRAAVSRGLRIAIVVLLVLAPVVAVVPTIWYAKATPVQAQIDYCSYHRRGHTTCMLSWTLDGQRRSGQISWVPGPLGSPVDVRVTGRFVVPRPLPFIAGSVLLVGLAVLLGGVRRTLRRP